MNQPVIPTQNNLSRLAKAKYRRANRLLKKGNVKRKHALKAMRLIQEGMYLGAEKIINSAQKTNKK